MLFDQGEDPVHATREELDELYNLRGWSMSDIARHFGVSETTIYRWMNKLGLPRRDQFKAGRRPPMDDDALRQELDNLYNRQRFSLPEIARRFKVSHTCVRFWMDKLGLTRRERSQAAEEASRKSLDGAEVERLYVAGLTLEEIGQQFGVSTNAILLRLKERNVARRGSREMHYPRRDFSGDPLEKAYLLGFRLGDLTVRMNHDGPNCATIRVTCSTSKTEQLDLLHTLFASYGYVNVNPDSKGVYHGLCWLNTSFDFLIPKRDRIPAWILRALQDSDPQPFVAFLAGYIDAEGYFHVQSNGKNAYLQLASYDVTILRQMQMILNDRIGIRCPPIRIAKPKGTPIKGAPYVSNNDLWCLSINRKASLARLCELLEPHLKHAKRRTDMHAVWANVKARGIES